MNAETTKLHRTKASPRDTNIELYRILSMLLIVAHHYVVNSGLTLADGPIFGVGGDPLALKSLFLLLFGAWGKIGINCFVLITGYFMCKSQITAKKFAKLFVEVMFYRLVINAVFWISGYAPFTMKSLINVILPFTKVAQNFTGTYLIFFLCIPFLNIFINSLNEKQHIKVILLCLFTYVLFGTIPFFSVSMNYVSWYMVLYFIASYIRLYPKNIFDSRRFWGIMTLASVAISAVSVVAGAWLTKRIGRSVAYSFVMDSNTFLAVLTGLSSFMFFKNIKIKYNKFINTVSATTFGVFLIHANSDVMRQWLWKDVLDNVGMYDSPIMPIHAVASVIVVFVVCSLLDLLRIHAIEKPFFRFWDKRWPGFAAKCVETENKIYKKLNIGLSEK